MRIAVIANDGQWSELVNSENEQSLERVATVEQAILFDAVIVLEKNGDIVLPAQFPVLINSVTVTLQQLQAGESTVRINGWKGFLERKSWEVAGILSEKMQEVFKALGKEYVSVKDEPGFIAARTLAMIINEAYFALGEQVSSKAAIDTAMKLGTNYPLGPFEWADKIGLKNIHELLIALNHSDSRYTPAPLLQTEATQ